MYNQRPFAEFPFVRLILPLIGGILAGFFYPMAWQTHLSIFLLCFTFFVFLSYFLHAGFQFRFRAYAFTFLILSIFGLGYSITQLNNQKLWRRHFSNFQHVDYLKIKLAEPLQKKKKTYKTVGEIEEVFSKDRAYKALGKVLLYIEPSDSLHSLYCGDLILVKPRVSPIQTAKNPNEFDYAKYMALQNIHAQIFLKKDQWTLLEKEQGFNLNTKIYRFRDRLVNILKKHIGASKETGVATALLFGYKDELDPEIVEAFTATGTLHILAVSGMHVMIIYAALNLLLEVLLKFNKGKYLRAIIIASVVWFYALLCGLSPSILRAAVMLTFILLGSLVIRYPNVFNSLAASAFFLLLYNPHYLFDAGFLLSYFAVFGLVIFQPLLYSWLIFKNKIADWIWNLTSVSLAAQLATFPISIYLFHQFPNYFLLSNLLLIPVTNFVIFGGAILLIVSPISVLAKTLGFLLNGLLWLTETVLMKIENLPGSLLTGLMPNFLETCLIYFLLLFVTLYLLNTHKKYLFMSLLVGVGLCFSSCLKNITSSKQNEIIIYSIKGYSVIQVIDGHSSILIADMAKLNNNIFAMKMLKENIWKRKIKKTSIYNAENPKAELTNSFRNFDYFQFNNLTVIRIKNKFVQTTIIPKIKVDYLIVSENARVDLNEVVNAFEFKKIIYDSSNNPFQVKKLISSAEKLGVNYYDVLNCGAFVESIYP